MGWNIYVAMCFVLLGLVLRGWAICVRRDGNVSLARAVSLMGTVLVSLSIPAFIILEFILKY